MRTATAVVMAGIVTLAAMSCLGPNAEPAAGAATQAAPRVVDLGHALSSGDPTWGGTPVFTYAQTETIAKDGYNAGHFASDEHFGTHVDAPAHFAAGGLTVDRISAEQLVRPAVCINVTADIAANEDYRLTAADVQNFERQHGAIPAGALVLVATGWDSRWPNQSRYLNTRKNVKHFPGLSVDAATLLAKDRHVAAIGIDTPSIDYGPSESFEAHHVTMTAGVYHIENATGLTTLPATGFTVVVAPVKIAGGSGSPARVFALLPAR